LTLKTAVSAGIGLFIAFIGLQNAKIVVNSDATLVTYQTFRGNFATEGITALLAIVGVVITAYLVIKKVKGDKLFAASFITSGTCTAQAVRVGKDNYIQQLSAKATQYAWSNKIK
jgi:xanthine/uracil/vitamin C permease (AzgA family)